MSPMCDPILATWKTAGCTRGNDELQMLQAAANSPEDAKRFDAVFLNCTDREWERERERKGERSMQMRQIN